MTGEFDRIGRGAYTLKEAFKLTRVPVRRIRRWTRGYEFELSRGREGYSPPIIETIDGSPALDFGALIEIRFINAFRESGVSWRSIRIAAARAAEVLSSRHPFSNRTFRTDGHTIIAELVTDSGDRRLLDLVRDQYEFRRIVTPYLHGLEFNARDEPERWWPLGRQRRVVIDPERSFGAPIIDTFGVPTLVLAQAVTAEGSISAAARLYSVSVAAVRNAVTFENSLAA